jgi:hypothetical protein
MNTGEYEEENKEDPASDDLARRDEDDDDESGSELSSVIAFGSTLVGALGSRHPGCSSFRATCKTLSGKASILQGSILRAMAESHKNPTRHS